MVLEAEKPSTKKVFPRKPMPVYKRREQVPTYIRKQARTDGLRLDKLSFGTLRRYAYYFKLGEDKA